MTTSRFGTRFTYGPAYAPDGKPGVVLRDYEQGVEVPFYLVDTAEHLAAVVLTAMLMIRDDNVPVLTGFDSIDVELEGIVNPEAVQFYGAEINTIPLLDELPMNIPPTD